jgi:23S rRNA (adenine-N6)-dimethyltransferase
VWGWHRLHPTWACRLVADAAIAPGDLVLDVGAGTGAVTGPLLDAGARVIAIERHPRRARELRRRYGTRVVVVEADATELRLPRRAYKVVANPPFAITTALVRRLLQPGSRLVAAQLVVQDAAARRWAGPEAPARGRWGSTFVVTSGARIPRSAFAPPPHVDARVLTIVRAR